MTFHTTQLGSFIGPVWQEISSLWSGVDFSFTDFLPELERPSQTQLSSTVSDKSLSESNHGRPEPCW
jgi:hypothetical protein